jgi:multidrug efflux pump subunit AcrA (membrane-fusion protein)
MKFYKALAIILAISGIFFLFTGCARTSNSATPAKPTIATVQRGNISVEVTGTGNLALEYKQGLSFGQTGLVSQASNAKISEVLVKPGDTVKQGQVLVKADTSDLEDTLTQDQHNLDKAESDLLTAQNNLATDQMKLSQQSDVQAIQTKIDTANSQIQTAQTMLQSALVSNDPNASQEVQYWNQIIRGNQANITIYQKQISDLLTDPEHYLARRLQCLRSKTCRCRLNKIRLRSPSDRTPLTMLSPLWITIRV